MKKNSKAQIQQYESLKDVSGNNILSIQTIQTLGYPNKPSCMAYSRSFGLLAIGTDYGKIVVIGAPGFTVNGELEDTRKIINIYFYKSKKKIITVSRDLNDHFVDIWDINELGFRANTCDNECFKLNDMAGSITTTCWCDDDDTLCIGTYKSSVSIYKISIKNLKSFVLTEEFMLQNVGLRKYSQTLGSVQSLHVGIENNQTLLIGYSIGTIVQWDLLKMKPISCVYTNECLFSACWGTNESMFVSSHTRGLICCWSPTNITSSKNIFGKYSPVSFRPREKISCLGIQNIIWRDSFFIFTGGIPDYFAMERNLLSIMIGGTITHVVEFGSKIIQFIDVSLDTEKYPELARCSFYLLVLTVEELVLLLIHPVVKETRSSLPQVYDIKQLAPFHFTPLNSSLINSSLVCNLNSNIFFERLVEMGKNTCLSKFEHKWPLEGGKAALKLNKIKAKILVFTGHEDGNIYIWNIYDRKKSSLLYMLSTSQLYIHSESYNIEEDEKYSAVCGINAMRMGFYDPYCDDQRFSIQKLCFCEETHTVIVGGAAGNVLMFKFYDGVVSKVRHAYIECNLMQKYPNFVWKGHEMLKLNEKALLNQGYVLDAMINIYPYSPICSIEYCLKWGLLGIGTTYGFVIYDCHNYKIMYCLCTYDVTALGAAGENIPRNSFLRSLRNSLRVFSSRKHNVHKTIDTQNKEPEIKSGELLTKPRQVSKVFLRTSIRESSTFRRPTTLTNKNRESQRFEALMKASSTRFVSGKKMDPSLRGIIRSMAFVEVPMQNTPKIKSMFVAGSNYGKLYILTLRFQNYDKHTYIKSVESTKEIQMNHKAPIINLKMIGLEYPMTFLSPLNEFNDKITPFDHYLLCCTEEQIKIINLFNLKTKMKLNVTFTRGIRIKKLFIFNILDNDISKLSNYLIGYSNHGNIMVISLNRLKCLNNLTFLTKEDILAINTITMTQYGFGIFQNSSSELIVFSIKSPSYNNPSDFMETSC